MNLQKTLVDDVCYEKEEAPVDVDVLPCYCASCSPQDGEQPSRAGGGGLPAGLHHGGRPPGGLCLQPADGPSTLNKS